MLGVHHATVASVRAELEAVGQIIQLDRRVERMANGTGISQASKSGYPFIC